MALACSILLKLGINVKPYMKFARQTYLSMEVFQKLEPICPEEVLFMVNNGDVFEGHFSKSKKCFIGLRDLLTRYLPEVISFLRLNYIDRGHFMVTIFDSTAIEIDYPSKPVYVKRKDVDFRRIPYADSYNYTTVTTLDEKLSNNILKFNAGNCNALKFCVYMPEQIYEEYIDFVRLDEVDEDLCKEWVDGTSLCLTVGDKYWKVTANKVRDRWFLSKGWTDFAIEVGVGHSDLVELYMSADHFCFEVAYYKEYAYTPKCVEKKIDRPRHFFKIVTNNFLQTGELTIPCLYTWKYEHELDAEMQILAPSGVNYNCLFLEFEGKFVQLNEFVSGNNLEEGYTLVFCKVEKSKMSVTIYDRNLLELQIV